MILQISRGVLQQLRDQGVSSYPEEGAGLILGTVSGEVRTARVLVPMENRYPMGGRRTRYRIDPKDLLSGERTAMDLGLDVIGIFHSHPDHPPKPSEFDKTWALPWFSYVITSIHNGEPGEIRSWRLSEDREQLDEEEIQVLEISPLEDIQ
jgi:proteasome lid subunit RPN8/RPN11